MLLSVGFPVTETCCVMSNERLMSSSFGFWSTNETFSMSGRPWIVGLMDEAGSTRDSAIEYAGWTLVSCAGVFAIVSGADVR